MNFPVALNILRAFFVMLCCLLGIGIAIGLHNPQSAWVGALSGTGFGVSLVGLDMLLKTASIRGFSAAVIGLLLGFLSAWVLTSVNFFDYPGADLNPNVARIVTLALYAGLGFLGMSLALRSDREEFSLIIPYVRFRQQGVQDPPLILDSNIIIDGRVSDIIQCGFLSGDLVAPRFILDELHVLADSPDAIKKERGRRGIENLKEMEQTPGINVMIQEDPLEGETLVDTKLIQLARRLDGRLLTNDQNLGKIARLQGISVLNINDLAKAVRPVILPGDHVELTLVKGGKDDHQAIGYLPDGTMIVVNHASKHIGSSAEVVVASALQTSAGRLIFAELKGNHYRRHPGDRAKSSPGA